MKNNFFSKNLKTWMFAHNLGQAQVAVELQMSTSTINKWLTNDKAPKGPALIGVCNYVGISPEDMLYKDLTYQILQDAKYIDNIVADGGDETAMYHARGKLARVTSHLQQVQDQLKMMLLESEKVLESVK